MRTVPRRGARRARRCRHRGGPLHHHDGEPAQLQSHHGRAVGRGRVPRRGGDQRLHVCSVRPSTRTRSGWPPTAWAAGPRATSGPPRSSANTWPSATPTAGRSWSSSCSGSLSPPSRCSSCKRASRPRPTSHGLNASRSHLRLTRVGSSHSRLHLRPTSRGSRFALAPAPDTRGSLRSCSRASSIENIGVFAPSGALVLVYLGNWCRAAAIRPASSSIALGEARRG